MAQKAKTSINEWSVGQKIDLTNFDCYGISKKGLTKKLTHTKSFYLLLFGQDSFYRKLFPKTILTNEDMNDCPIRTAINIWMALYGKLIISCTAKIFREPFWASQIFIAGVIVPSILIIRNFQFF